jgi:hypothetical protein
MPGSSFSLPIAGGHLTPSQATELVRKLGVRDSDLAQRPAPAHIVDALNQEIARLNPIAPPRPLVAEVSQQELTPAQQPITFAEVHAKGFEFLAASS